MPSLPLRQLPLFDISIGMLTGICAGIAISISSYWGANMAVGVAMVIVVAAIVFLRPSVGVVLFLLCIIVIEEFPSGYGDTLERSLRTPFYSKSLGIPGLYAPDVLMAGLIGLLLMKVLLRRRKGRVTLDGIFVALMLLAAAAVFSVCLSLLSGKSLDVVYKHTGTLYLVNERGAKFVGFFQLKNYSYLFLSYLFGLLFIESPDRIRIVKNTFLAAVVIDVFIGIYRLSLFPSMVVKMIPLFYHSPTSWIFILMVFYVIAAWANGLLSGKQVLWLGILSVILMFFILVSFRRAIWGGITIATMLFLFLIPGRAALRISMLAILCVSTVLLFVLASPVGQLLINTVYGRVTSTTLMDTSTLYRYTVFLYFYQNISDIPFFGYGAQPLWDKTVSLGLFVTNLENIHSLYYWLLVRTGLAGFFVAIAGFGVIWRKIRVFIKKTGNAEYRVLSICVLMALLILLFSGIFNPVYGEVRYMTIMGLGLSLVSRMIQFDRGDMTRTPLPVT